MVQTAALTPDSPFIAARTTDVRLHDGLVVRIRPIVPGDQDELRRGYEKLSAQSRYRRFISPPGHLTAEMLAYLTDIDYRDHYALVAFAVSEPGTPGVAVARYVRLRDEPDAAEAAVTVLDAYQKRGIATVLMQVLAVVAAENGVRRFTAYALRENPILDMARAASAEVVDDAPGVVRVEVDLAAMAGEFRATPQYGLFRALARGELTLRTRELRRAVRAGAGAPHSDPSAGTIEGSRRLPAASGRALGAGEEMEMAQEKHRGAPKKQVKKQSAQSKAKAAKKAAARAGTAPQEQS